MSQEEMKTRHAPTTRERGALRKPNNQPYTFPTVDFIAGLIVGGTLTTCGIMGDNVMLAYGKVTDHKGRATHDIRFHIGVSLVLADLEFARALVEMYDWCWEDTVFDHDGVVHCYVRPNDDQCTKFDPRDMTESEISKTCRAQKVG